ncbi:hypothetical protein Sango_3060600 [Sesamum angolense]|uniref:Tf2-1-like SH3-like domain-containing protein n=1 Tax=Sesamum angolense TaxID=2727404 RepID=A0AAE1TBS4_9LAMI|nr:hypothetical protein Sango_3060600 [Sesamum angolense]
MRSMNTKLKVDQMARLLAALQLMLDFLDQIKEAQTRDPFLLWMLEAMEQGKKSNFSIRDDGVIVNGERICVPNVEGLRRGMEYEIGDKVFLKVSPWKGILRFGKQRNLSQRYIGPYEIIERIRPLAYRLALPSELS